MVDIAVDEATLERLKSHARPFLDVNPDAVINRALDALDQQAGVGASKEGTRMDSERRIDPQRLPDLTHTKVLDAMIGGIVVARPKWNHLRDRMVVKLAKERARNFDELNRLCPANMVQGRKQEEGYRFLSEIDVSVQGQPANGAGLAIVTAAQRLGIALDIGFMWRNTERAAHPGDRARIRVAGEFAASSREANEKRDLNIINAHADELNEEAVDVLGYQVEM